MQSFWNSLDPIVLPIAICDAKGVIVYKNEAARELDLLRLGSNLRPTLDAPSRLRFANLVPSGDILSVNGKLTLHRALAFPFALENKHFVAFLFTEALLGMEPGEERIQMLLSLVPHLRRMLTQPQARMQLTLGAFRGKRSLNARVMTLMRKMMDLYLSQRADADEMPVDIHYFRSVLTYYFRTVYKPFGIQIAIADSVEDCPFLFYEHRDLAAMLLFTLQLLLDRSGAARVYIDVTTEGAPQCAPSPSPSRSGRGRAHGAHSSGRGCRWCTHPRGGSPSPAGS